MHRLQVEALLAVQGPIGISTTTRLLLILVHTFRTADKRCQFSTDIVHDIESDTLTSLLSHMI